MRYGLDELRRKEVIDVRTGEKLGYIDDVELDVESRMVRGFWIYGRRYFGGIIRREEDLFVPCEEVRLYGKDVILTQDAVATRHNAQNKE